ncbi:MAG: Holliday junction resolvase RuvX [Planctomycetaceae bacterium]
MSESDFPTPSAQPGDAASNEAPEVSPPAVGPKVTAMGTTSGFVPPFQGMPLPMEGAIMGIDHGEKRLGFAISTTDQTLASPLENYTRRNNDLDARRLKECVVDYRVRGIVVGLPLHVGGDESTQSHRARLFGKWVHEVTELPVTFYDERYSSTLADDFMLEIDMSRKHRKKRRDMLAAHLFLQSYLNHLHPAPLRDEASERDSSADVSPTDDYGIL